MSGARIIITCDRAITDQQAMRIRELFEQQFPGDRCLVLDGGFRAQAMPPSYRELAAMHIMAALVASCETVRNDDQLAAEAWESADALIARGKEEGRAL